MSDSFGMTDGNANRQVRHTVGLDLGTSSLRLQIAHYDALGRPVGEPAAVHLPNSERDGVMPTVLQLSPGGDLLSYGRAAVQRLPHTTGTPGPEGPRFVAEFKPCIGQAPEDLAAQGRPEKARHCTHPGCSRPGWAWSVALQFCGFCGAPLTEPTERWAPLFPYRPEEALEYARLLLSEVRQHLERRLNEPLQQGAGWQVVAGVPVHWQAGTRASYQQVLAQAFPEAGITLLSEPEGALRYYGCQGLVRAGDGWTLVVDFGAGTTDLVLGRVFNRGNDQLLGEVRAYGERYGGADFDLLLAQYAAAELGVELDAPLLSRWKLEAQRWKEAFSDAAQFDPVAETGFSFPVPVGEGGCDFRQVVVNRQTFQRVAGELVERFRSVVERGLRHFGAGANEITQVVLTGGGAQWYFVEEAVRELCPGAHVIGGVEPVRAIARGLALAPALPQLLDTPPRRPDPPVPEPLPAEKEQNEAPRPLRGEDIPSELALTWQEAEEGCRKVVVTGFGEVPVTLTPGSATDGETLRIPGGGAPGQHGGEPGDLLLRLQVARKPEPQPAEAEPRKRPNTESPGDGRATLYRTLQVTGRLMAAAFSPDGEVVATGIEAGITKWGKGKITLWDASSGVEQRSLPGEIPRSLAFSADGTTLGALFLSGPTGTNSRVSLIDLGPGSVLWSRPRNELPSAIGISPNADLVVTSHYTSSGISVGFWKASTGEGIHFLNTTEVVNPLSLAFSSPDSAVAIPCCTPGGTGLPGVRVYRKAGKELAAWITMPDRGFAWKWAFKEPWIPVAFSMSGETLAVGSRVRTAAGISGRVYLFQWRHVARTGDPKRPRDFADLQQEGAARVLDGHRDQVLQLAFSPDRRTLATGSADGTIGLWDLETGTQRQTLTAHSTEIHALAFSNRGSRMMSASTDGVIQIWTLAPDVPEGS